MMNAQKWLGRVLGVALVMTAATSPIQAQLPTSGAVEQAASSSIHGSTVSHAVVDGSVAPLLSNANQGFCCPNQGAIAGAEFLFIRPHFSEANAFAVGSQTATSYTVETRELHFDYEGSVRAFVGYQFADGSDLRLTYWHFDGETSHNSAAPAGGFLVDPFGNIAGTAIVFDPRDGRFLPPPPGPGPTILGGGTDMRTHASVQMNVYDLESTRPLAVGQNWRLHWSAGARLADVDQFYEAVSTAGGVPVSRGDFDATFLGAGPRLGLGAERAFGQYGDWSVFARGAGSLLVGEHEIRSSNTTTIPASFQARQSESLTKTVPVFEAEIGTRWRPANWMTLSAGWTFQAWFDLGTSGGTFGGFFNGADDGNTMSFDGLFVRSEFLF